MGLLLGRNRTSDGSERQPTVWHWGCEPAYGLSGSRYNRLTLMDCCDYTRQRPVMVLDLETWSLYTVAYHDGSVIGWREN